MISTFESLFRHGLRDFKGLAIEKLWIEESKPLVVRLDFSEIKNFSSPEDFSRKFTSLISRCFGMVGFQYVDDDLNSASGQLSTWLQTLDINALVVLIDEYDAPLTSCLNQHGLFNSVRERISEFYAVLKSNDRALRFVFVTGITKFNKTSIFSELNNLSDISLAPQFGSLLGYTHEEVQTYFGSYIAKSAEVLSISQNELMNRLAAHYDGFCFEETGTKRVFVPWSLLNFLAQPDRGLKDYWFESGGKPAVLLEYLKSHALKDPEEYARDKTIALSELAGSSDVETLSDIGLLTQAGYLTIKSVEFGNTVFLDYPNLEVKRAMAQLYTEHLLDGKVAGQVGAGPIVKLLYEESAESVFHILNRLFLAIDYQRYPVRDEASLRAYVQVYFAGAGLDVKVEHHNAHGRSDLEVNAGNRHWIFEFKVVQGNKGETEKLSEAVEQIKQRHYGDQQYSQEVKRVALVFSIEDENSSSGKKCRGAACTEPDGFAAPDRVNFSVSKNFAISLLSICCFIREDTFHTSILDKINKSSKFPNGWSSSSSFTNFCH